MNGQLPTSDYPILKSLMEIHTSAFFLYKFSSCFLELEMGFQASRQ